MRRITPASDVAGSRASVYARARREVLLVVEPDADAARARARSGPCAGRAPPATWARRAAGRSSVRGVVAVDAREAGVDHVEDAGDGERGLGDVGREDDAPLRPRVEDALLLGRREARVERQHLRRAAGACCAAPRPPRGSRARRAGRRARRPAAVAAISSTAFDDGLAHVGGLVVLVLAGLDELGAVEHLHREGAARDLDHGRARRRSAEKRSVSIVAELTITRRSGALGRRRLQVAEQEVDVEAALVRLVDDDRVVARAAAGRPGSRRAGCRRSSNLTYVPGRVRSAKRIL